MIHDQQDGRDDARDRARASDGVAPDELEGERTTRGSRHRAFPLLVTVLVMLMVVTVRRVRASHELVLEPSRIPLDAVVPGGPEKDGIPALVDPAVVDGGIAEGPAPGDRVLGLRVGGEARAYPVRILNWHELVNDTLGGVPVLVTYCPLCGSGLAFERRVAGGVLEFGVSGLLYDDNVLMYDRADGGLWSQMRMEAVTGPRVGTRLVALPIAITTWKAWRRAEPRTTVLSFATGYRRDYSRDPYLGYAEMPGLMFPVSHRDGRRVSKEWVVGIERDGVARAYPYRELACAPRPVVETIGGARFVVDYDAQAESATVTREGTPVAATIAYWFAWAAFHPETTIFTACDERVPPSSVPSAARDASAWMPLADRRWWVYEERTRGGELAAVERWKVRAQGDGRFALRSRRRAFDARADDVIAVAEVLERRLDGIARVSGDGRPPAYLLHSPVRAGDAWADGGGHCRVTETQATVHAAVRSFVGCVEVSCTQGDAVRVVSSYAQGVGLVHQEVRFGGLGAVGLAGIDAVGEGSGRDQPAASTLLLTAWGARTASKPLP